MSRNFSVQRMPRSTSIACDTEGRPWHTFDVWPICRVPIEEMKGMMYCWLVFGLGNGGC